MFHSSTSYLIVVEKTLPSYLVQYKMRICTYYTFYRNSHTMRKGTLHVEIRGKAVKKCTKNRGVGLDLRLRRCGDIHLGTFDPRCRGRQPSPHCLASVYYYSVTHQNKIKTYIGKTNPTVVEMNQVSNQILIKNIRKIFWNELSQAIKKYEICTWELLCFCNKINK